MKVIKKYEKEFLEKLQLLKITRISEDEYKVLTPKKRESVEVLDYQDNVFYFLNEYHEGLEEISPDEVGQLLDFDNNRRLTSIEQNSKTIKNILLFSLISGLTAALIILLIYLL